MHGGVNHLDDELRTADDAQLHAASQTPHRKTMRDRDVIVGFQRMMLIACTQGWPRIKRAAMNAADPEYDKERAMYEAILEMENLEMERMGRREAVKMTKEGTARWLLRWKPGTPRL